MGSLIIRKLITTFVTTIVTSILFAFFTLKESHSKIIYSLGNEFMGWFFIFFMYIGIIILIYGNLVSIGIEHLQRKWFIQHDWLYVLILGIFGLANGLLFQASIFALYGMLAALLYGGIDKWLYKRSSESKGIKMFFLLPIASLLLFWGYFHFISPPMSSFTKEEAVEFATSGEGDYTDYFPKEIGEWQGTIEGYQVEKKTTVKEIEEEMYIVSFEENWKKGTQAGNWTLSYKVERDGLGMYDEKGELPPYYESD